MVKEFGKKRAIGRPKKVISGDARKSYYSKALKELNEYKIIIKLNERIKSFESFKSIQDFPNLYTQETSGMLIAYINLCRKNEDSKIIPIINKKHFLNTIVKLIHYFDMNENEICALTLVLDKLTWTQEYIKSWEHIFYCIIVLTLQKIFKKLENYKDENVSKLEQKIGNNIFDNINFTELNKRRMLLKQQYEDDKKNKFVDLNEVVDTMIDNARFYEKNK